MDRAGQGQLEPGAEHPRAALLDEQVAVLQQPQELLDVERVAFCSFEDGDPHLTDLGVVEQPGDELDGLRIRQRSEVDPADVVHASRVVGVTFVEFGSGGSQDEQRHTFRSVSEVLEERQHRVVGPVKVFEHEHRWGLLRDGFEERAPGGEELVALSRRRRIHAHERQ